MLFYILGIACILYYIPAAGWISGFHTSGLWVWPAAAVLFIGVTTFVISAFGVRIGNIFGTKYKSKAELAGGIILILLGLKILLEHLGIL